MRMIRYFEIDYISSVVWNEMDVYQHKVTPSVIDWAQT